MSADKSASDAAFNDKLDDYKFMYEMGTLTKMECVNWYNGFGDFEQGFSAVSPSIINSFYNESGRYLDIYTLCAYQRRYVQIQAIYDPCCFGGKFYQTWIDKTSQTVARVGGYYKHYLTQQNCHCVGSKISIVLSEI